MIVVVDASVAIKWFIPEDHTSEAELLLTDDFQLHAPELLLPEFANILWKKSRARDITDAQADTALSYFSRNRTIELHRHDDLVKTALDGAVETGHAVYDWIYLSLALSLSCQFLTADRRLFLAMRKTRFKDHLTWIENIPSLL